MRVRLGARSHNPADLTVPRFAWQIPVGGEIVVEATEEQVEWLRRDPWVTVVAVQQAMPQGVDAPAAADGDEAPAEEVHEAPRVKRRR